MHKEAIIALYLIHKELDEMDYGYETLENSPEWWIGFIGAFYGEYCLTVIEHQDGNSDVHVRHKAEKTLDKLARLASAVINAMEQLLREGATGDLDEVVDQLDLERQKEKELAEREKEVCVDGPLD
jgi:hypothetical protein